MGCIWMLFSGKGPLHSRGHEGDGRVPVDALVGEVSTVEQPAPGSQYQSINQTSFIYIVLDYYYDLCYFYYNYQCLTILHDIEQTVGTKPSTQN